MLAFIFSAPVFCWIMSIFREKELWGRVIRSISIMWSSSLLPILVRKVYAS